MAEFIASRLATKTQPGEQLSLIWYIQAMLLTWWKRRSLFKPGWQQQKRWVLIMTKLRRIMCQADWKWQTSRDFAPFSFSCNRKFLYFVKDWVQPSLKPRLLAIQCLINKTFKDLMCTNRFRGVGNGSSSSYSSSKHLSILGLLSRIRFGDFDLKWRA